MTDISLVFALQPVFDWLQDWSEVISGLGSVLLSGGLLYLYFQQTTILEEQRQLRAEELNREVRQNHTETLRKRVRMWHGDPDREEPDLENGSGLNLGHDLNIPRVTLADIEPAPAEIEVFPSDESFRVIPEKLQGDRYLEDLLENHAIDLKKSKNKLEDLEREISELKSTFIEEYEEGDTIEREDYVLEPASYFPEWILKQLFRIERGNREDTDEIMEIATDGIERATGLARPDEGEIFFPLRDSEQAVYVAKARSGDLDDIDKHEEQIKEEILMTVEQALNEAEESPLYDTVKKASEKLDDAAKEVRNLENLLIKYEGQQIYPGHCSYIEEASIGEE